MNNVILMGRTTAVPEVRYSQGDKPTAVARFTLAVDRPVKSGEEKKADFPRVVCFGKTAEFIEKYVGKGQKIAVQGRIQTGSYKDNNGNTVYTTDIIAEKVEPCEWQKKEENPNATPDGFYPVSESVEDDDLPF